MEELGFFEDQVAVVAVGIYSGAISAGPWLGKQRDLGGRQGITCSNHDSGFPVRALIVRHFRWQRLTSQNFERAFFSLCCAALLGSQGA